MNWDDSFNTENGILKNKNLHKPEVLFLGTFNPALRTNPADFFYGRNFFWPGFKNLFNYNQIIIHTERLDNNPYNPTLIEIFDLCNKLSLTFCDLISSIFNHTDNNTLILRREKEYIQFNNIEYNPIKDGDLEQLDRIGKVKWNTQEIIKYLKQTPSIKKIYFTRSISGHWATQINYK